MANVLKWIFADLVEPRGLHSSLKYSSKNTCEEDGEDDALFTTLALPCPASFDNIISEITPRHLINWNSNLPPGNTKKAF